MSHGRRDPVSPEPYYDQVPAGSLPRVGDDLRPLRGPLLTRSADPLPPPPLPDQPPVGPQLVERELDPGLDIKPVHRFIPDSWKNFFRGSGRSDKPWSMPGSDNNNSSTPGVRCSPPRSPPRSPSLQGSYRDPYGGSGRSCHSGKELLEVRDSVSGRTQRSGLSYGERVEQYQRRYAYMKSWAGLLRILGCVELLLGAAVFACVCAYIHKDQEWSNMFGYSAPGAAYGGMYGAGSYYRGPMTTFVLVVAGLAWLVTVMVLVLGMTMYYRTILLDSTWWPLTEFTVNLVLALLFMAAGIVYVRDTTRGGLCYLPVFNNGINGVFCRTEAGQTAALVFLFATMVVYLIGAAVCLKLWRHEAARRQRERYGQEMQPTSDPGVVRPQVRTQESAVKTPQQVQSSSVVPIRAGPAPPRLLQGVIPSGHIPKPVVVPDYVAKYPTIRSDEERDQYRAVFNDQYAEYKELHADVQAADRKFQQMDAMMRSLPQQPASRTEAQRIDRILDQFQRKKNDPTLLEKKERCEYLKNKLSHIKQQIQDYDQDWSHG